MKKTENLKKLFHKPNITLWSSALLILFFILAIVAMRNPKSYTFREAIHGTYQPVNKFPEVRIFRNGVFDTVVSIYNEPVKNNSDIPKIISEIFEEKEIDKKKVLLKVHYSISFGEVVKVLEILKKANIEVVGLITKECETYAGFLFKKR